MIIPADNVKDLEEIDQTVRNMLTFVPVRQADEVLAQVLAGERHAPADHTAGQLPEASRTSRSPVNLRQ